MPPPGSKPSSSINPVASSGGGIRAGIGSRSANARVEASHQKRNSVIHQVSSQKQKQQSQSYSHAQIKIAKMVNHLVQKRQRSLIHIQKAFTKEGSMWMNCIKIHEQDIKQLIMASAVTSNQDGPFSTQKAPGQSDYQGAQNN